MFPGVVFSTDDYVNALIIVDVSLEHARASKVQLLTKIFQHLWKSLMNILCVLCI